MFQNNLLMAAGKAPAVVTSAFTANDATATDLGSYTFSSQALGTAAADRIIVVGVQTHDYSNSFVSGTVAGQTLSQIATSGAGNHTLFLLQASVASGTSGDIFVDWSSTSTNSFIGVWALYGANSTVSDTAVGTNDANPATANIDCPAGGTIIGMVRHYGSPSHQHTHTWTNLTEDFDVYQEYASVSGAHDNFTAAQSGLTISAQKSGGGTHQSRFCLASYGPA